MSPGLARFVLVWYDTDRSTGWSRSETGMALLKAIIALLIVNLLVSLVRLVRNGRS